MHLALKKHKRATIALGTIVEVSLWLPEHQTPAPFFKVAYDAIHLVHQHMSVHDDASDLGRYRLAMIGEVIAISPQTASVLAFSERLWQQSQGLFDVCIGQVLANQAYLPKSWVLHELTYPRSLMLNIIHHDNQYSIEKQTNYMIDLGGVAKGYAVDLAIEALQLLDVPAALINAGGDMRIYGEVTEPIHLRQLDQYQQIYFQYLTDLNNQALASSGMPTNLEHAHSTIPIVNPITQKCITASTNMKSVIAPTAMIADAFTKLAWLDAENSSLVDSLLATYNSYLFNT